MRKQALRRPPEAPPTYLDNEWKSHHAEAPHHAEPLPAAPRPGLSAGGEDW